jgi:PKD repeat protein
MRTTALIAAVVLLRLCSAGSAVGSPFTESSHGSQPAPPAKTQNTHDETLKHLGIEPHSSHPSGTRAYTVCPPATKERFSCQSVVVPERLASERRSSLAGPRLEGSGQLGGYSPVDLRSAYGIPAEGGKGMTIAITIAYDYPKAESDLAAYRENYGLAPCTNKSGCFEKVNQEGKPENYPQANEEWSAEAALDLDMASAICPECKLLLVEANDSTVANLPVAVSTAAEHGASVISDSWGGEELSEEASLDPHLDHPGVPVLFASGDFGYGAEYPASSAHVIAVGGTSLNKDQSARGWRETAWIGAGSGCSRYEEKPAWQTDLGCAKRTVTDVSAVADPETPVSVYDTYGRFEGWQLFGGTSVATPLLAGVEAHSSETQRSKGAALFWEQGPQGMLYDIGEGRNGACRPEPEYLCVAKLGYDGPTGWGSPGARGRPGAPFVASYDATGVSTSEATLHGAIDPNGDATIYRFEYGQTSAYGTSVPVPSASAGSGTNAVEVAAQLIGLQRDVTYHYRLLATNLLGTTYGGDHTFATSPWAAQDVPRKKPQREEMLGVSCASASFCVSVGEQGVYFEPPAPFYNNAPLVERWNGNEWVRETVPVYHQPADGFASGLESVSCSSPSFCMAVGENYGIGVGYGTLVERWNGKEWSLVPAPLPSEAAPNQNGTHEVRLHGVSCVSATYCVLVGEFTKGWNTLSPEEIGTLVETWDGSSWTVEPSPNPSGGKQNLLWGVSCVSSASCVAVGESRKAGGGKAALVERWDGSKWSIDASPALSGGLQDVSCSSQSACMAVGGTQGRLGGGGVAETWNGSGWASSSLEHPMRGVSCLAEGSCVAVGGDLSSHQAYAERWNGTEWSSDRLARPTDASDEPMEIDGVSCLSSGCTAVGWYYAWGYAPLAEHRSPEPTAIAAPAVTSDPADSITQTAAVLHGHVNNEGAEAGSSCRFVVALESSPGTPVAEPACVPNPVVGAGSRPVEASAGSLSANTNYVYRVLAENAGGSTTGTPDQRFRTLDDPPSAIFSVTTATPTASRPVVFDASSSSDPDGTIARYSWSFGDGATATGAIPSHVYAAPGRYTVMLTVTDNGGQATNAERVITVADAPPTASFSVSSPSPTAGKPVAFDGSSSSDADGTIASYAWSFGDGGTASGMRPVHLYARPGLYTVVLTVTDNGARTSSIQRAITVAPPSNSVWVAGAKQNRNGSVTLTIVVPGPGTLGVRQARASIRASTRRHKGTSTFVEHASVAVSGGGAVTLRIVPTTSGLRQLNSRHRLSVTVLITFAPADGIPRTIERTLVLRLHAGTRAGKTTVLY